MALGTAIVIGAFILFFIARPGLALTLGVIAVIGFVVLMSSRDKQTEERVREHNDAKRMALAAIKPDDLSMSDITLSGPNFVAGHFLLQGSITNNSKFPINYMGFEVTITDCENSTSSSASNGSKTCKTVGQRTIGVSLDVPPSQTRVFKTAASVFDGMPQPDRCLDNAPSTWHHLVGPGASEDDRLAYNEGFVRGRSFLHPKLGFTFTAPEGFALKNKTDTILGANGNRDEAFRFETVDVPAQQTLSEYLNSGWIKTLDPKSIKDLVVNGLPAATATAKDNQWAFRLYLVQFKGAVYLFTFSSKGLTRGIDRTFYDTVSSFHTMTLAEAECPKGRSFAWEITEIQAAGFGRLLG
jgi:hypothetical protein